MEIEEFLCLLFWPVYFCISSIWWVIYNCRWISQQVDHQWWECWIWLVWKKERAALLMILVRLSDSMLISLNGELISMWFVMWYWKSFHPLLLLKSSLNGFWKGGFWEIDEWERVRERDINTGTWSEIKEHSFIILLSIIESRREWETRVWSILVLLMSFLFLPILVNWMRVGWRCLNESMSDLVRIWYTFELSGAFWLLESRFEPVELMPPTKTVFELMNLMISFANEVRPHWM